MLKLLTFEEIQVEINKIASSIESIASEPLKIFFHDALQMGLRSVAILENKHITHLEETLQDIYAPLTPSQYNNHFCSPVYSESQTDKTMGQLLTFISAQVHQSQLMAYKGEVDQVYRSLALVVLAHEGLMTKGLAPEVVIETVGEFMCQTQEKFLMGYFADVYAGANQTFTEITLKSDLSDLSYLYRYGVYISEYELRMAKFLNGYDPERLDHLAESIVKAYVNGFKRDNKDMSKRKAVRLIANAGQEQLTRKIIKHLEKVGLVGYVQAVMSTEFNQQFAFDHKFDKGLYLNEAINAANIEALKNAAAYNGKLLNQYSGVLFVEKFGEEPFSPQNNASRIKLDDMQQGLHQKFQIEQSQVIESYIPETERSFCIVAFPSPEIGDQFEAIFEDVVKINQLDSDLYEGIQQVIIDALDKGDYVHVKGYKGNETDILVKLQPLKNPEKETNFVNCVADVNIPVGEVFTSPMLTGTKGTLHVDTVYLNNFNYENLKLVFEDGYITSYDCSNFQDLDKNKEYVRENLMFPHQTLPIGEFAIGTNTLAYVIGEKYGIIDKMPILIVEKMGPHFAIGDTCFSWAEDHPVFNPTDGKEITARDNERSILRKEDVSKAYTNCHTDITIPYDSLEHITVVTHSGERIPLIIEGRFVLPGTEPLNAPFDEK